MLLLALAACTPGSPKVDPGTDTGGTTDTYVSEGCWNGYHDLTDCDGYLASEGDCDDFNPDVHPGATDVCNGMDDDCDDEIDEDGAAWTYADTDGDGYGDPDAAFFDCETDGRVTDASDCDDGVAAIHPGADEVCDGIDQDCDGVSDEDLPLTTWYTDADGDGAGAPGSGVEACEQPPGTAATGGDCNDADPATTDCRSCQEVLDFGVGTADGVYTLDPCGGAPSDHWCDLTSDGGGWTVAGWQAADGTTTLGLSVRNSPGDADFSVDLACVPYDEIAVFDRTHGGWEAESYPGSTWSETSINLAIGDPGLAFAQGTYGPAGIVMGCVDYAYAGAVVLAYACDTDWGGGARGHIADYAGEYCGARLDSTWAWTDGVTCSYTGEPYTWGFAIRGYPGGGGND